MNTSLVAQVVKCLSTMLETWVQSLGWEDLLEKEMTIHSSTIAWRIPWTEEPGRLQSMGLQRVDITEWCNFNFIYVLAGTQALRTRHSLRVSGRIPGDWAEICEDCMKNGAERTLHKHKDRHTWFIALCFIAFFTNWKFVANLVWASLSVLWFQQHFLISSCLCVTFW